MYKCLTLTFNQKNNAGAGDARNARTARDVDQSQSAGAGAVWHRGAVTTIGGGPPKASPP